MALRGFRYTLGWGKDFRILGTVPLGSHHSAHTEAPVRGIGGLRASLGSDGSYRLRPDSVTILVRMDRDNSWVVRDARSDALLSHEQVHYNIAALGARDLERKLLALSADSPESLESERVRVEKEIDDLMESVNNDYDDDFWGFGTDHGTREFPQMQWKFHIDAQMNSPNGRLVSIYQMSRALP